MNFTFPPLNESKTHYISLTIEVEEMMPHTPPLWYSTFLMFTKQEPKIISITQATNHHYYKAFIMDYKVSALYIYILI